MRGLIQGLRYAARFLVRAPETALNRFELQIVGVVGNVRVALDEDALPKIYVPYKQFFGELRAMMLAVRTTTDAVSVAPDVRAVAQAMDDRIIIDRIQTMDQVRGSLVADERFATLLLGMFSAIALVLAAACIYGVMSHAVVRRTEEIGVRLALGARGQDFVLMVLGQGFRLIGAGIALGMLGSFILTRILSDRRWGVSAPDPWTMTAVALLLGAIGLLACYVPARRATRVDPG
jgi:putative ABC transport system permease protein